MTHSQVRPPMGMGYESFNRSIRNRHAKSYRAQSMQLFIPQSPESYTSCIANVIFCRCSPNKDMHYAVQAQKAGMNRGDAGQMGKQE